MHRKLRADHRACALRSDDFSRLELRQAGRCRQVLSVGLAGRCITQFICAALAVSGAQSYAKTYPARPIRLVVPLAPAGAGDIVARTVTAKLSELWGQQIVIDNRPGANTIIGTDLVAKARPDGYTWLLGVQGSLAINPASYAKLPYDAVKDFDPVTQLT